MTYWTATIQIVKIQSRLLDAKPRARSVQPRGSIRESLFVVLEEQAPGACVAVHDIEDSAAFVGHHGVGDLCTREQINSLLDLGEAAFGEPPLVQCVSANQLLAYNLGSPDAELSAAFGVDAVADGEALASRTS